MGFVDRPKYIKNDIMTIPFFEEGIPARTINQTIIRELLKTFKLHQLCDSVREFNCEETYLYKLLMGNCFIVVFVVALIGNITNIFVYNRDHIRFYLAIKLLCTKLFVNTLTMLFMLPHTLRLLNVWSTGTAADRFYWVYWPYETFFVNTLGFCATWLTVLMTAECFINVYSPGLSKQFCTKRNIIICYLIIFVLGMLMGSIYPLNRDVQYHNHCGKWKAIISTSESALMNTMERGHTIVNLFLTILIPVTLLCFLTAAIVWKFVFQRSTKSGVILKLSSEKRCVTRITLITTILLLVSELPAVPVFLYSFFSGPKVIHANKGLCIWHSVSHFLGICSASLSFFVYFFFSQRFRQTVLVAIKTLAKRICPNWSKNQNSLNTIPSQSEEKMQVNHRRRSSYMISDNNGLFSRNSKRRTSSSNGIYKQKSSMELENEATCMQLLSAIPSGPVSNV